MSPGRVLAASSLIAVMAFDPGPASGCSLRVSTPLWTTIEQADWVVLARVESLQAASPESTAPGATPSDSLERDVAVLKVLETWKGSRERELRVHFSSEGFRDRLSTGKTIVIFLERGESILRRRDAVQATLEDDLSEPRAEDGLSEPQTDTTSREEGLAEERFRRAWESHRIGRIFPAGDSSTILLPEGSEVRSLRDLVATAVSLHAGGPVDAASRREWLVFAAAERATRAATLIDLEALVNASGQGTALSSSEAGTIAAGFTKAPSADESLPALLRILSGYEDSELDRAAVSVLEAALAAPRIPFWVPDVIARIVARSGRRDWGSSIWQRHLENGTLRDLWPSVAGDLHLSGIPPARVRIEGALRAGPD